MYCFNSVYNGLGTARSCWATGVLSVKFIFNYNTSAHPISSLFTQKMYFFIQHALYNNLLFLSEIS